MLIVENDIIYLTKGDDGAIPVSVQNGEEEYILGEGDTLALTVRELPTAESPVLMLCKSTPGSNRIIINSADTEQILPGRYSADIQLTDASGMKTTVWPLPEGSERYRIKNFQNFVIMPEVTTE